MPAYIRRRTTGRGERRFDVIYRRGGRGWPVEHAGTFRTVREATIRRDTVADWLAAGRNPRAELELLLRPPTGATAAVAGADWLASRVDLDESTRSIYKGLLARIDDRFDTTPIDRITPTDVSDWIQQMVADGLAPGTINNYVRTLRMILDVLDDNPARHKSVRLPRRGRRVVVPPDADEVLELLAALRPRWRPVTVMLEVTGMRVSEACEVRAHDIDRGSKRILVEQSKTDTPRWVPIPDWYAEIVQPVGGDRHGIGSAMRRVSEINPHLLRHRRATLWHQQGVPAVTYASWLGHDPVEALRTYSHVRPISECHPSDLAAVLLEEG